MPDSIACAGERGACSRRQCDDGGQKQRTITPLSPLTNVLFIAAARLPLMPSSATSSAAFMADLSVVFFGQPLVRGEVRNVRIVLASQHKYTGMILRTSTRAVDSSVSPARRCSVRARSECRTGKRESGIYYSSALSPLVLSTPEYLL